MAKISKGQLEKLQKKFQTDDAIGKLFGITRQAIHQLRCKYDIPPLTEKHKARNQDIIQLYKAGFSGTKIAKKYKLSISQTYRIINDQSLLVTKKGVAKKAAKKTVVKKKSVSRSVVKGKKK